MRKTMHYNCHQITILERNYTNGKRFDFFVHSDKLYFKYSGTKRTERGAITAAKRAIDSKIKDNYTISTQQQ
jgi:hypothetical protein